MKPNPTLWEFEERKIFTVRASFKIYPNRTVEILVQWNIGFLFDKSNYRLFSLCLFGSNLIQRYDWIRVRKDVILYCNNNIDNKKICFQEFGDKIFLINLRKTFSNKLPTRESF